MSTSISPPLERYLGIDLHKHYLVIGGVNAKQEVVLPPRRIEWLIGSIYPTASSTRSATRPWPLASAATIRRSPRC